MYYNAVFKLEQVISMLGTWHDSSFVTPLMSELPILMAKSSAVYNPIIYALSHPRYREVGLYKAAIASLIFVNKKMNLSQ